MRRISLWLRRAVLGDGGKKPSAGDSVGFTTCLPAGRRNDMRYVNNKHSSTVETPINSIPFGGLVFVFDFGRTHR